MAGLADLLSLAPDTAPPADCVISLGPARREITDLYPFLDAVSVECGRDAAWAGRLEFSSVRDEQGRWVVQDAPGLAAWQPVRIEAAFGSSRETVLDGYIREIRAEYPENAGDARVTVEVQDASLALDREHKRRAWGDTDDPYDDGRIAAQILQEHGLTPSGTPGSGLSGLRLLQDATDAAFLRERADINGYELLFTPDGVYYGPPRLQGRPQPALVVYGGAATNCVTFAARIDAHAPEAVAYDTLDEGSGSAQTTTVTPSLAQLGAQPAAASAPGLDPFTWRLSRAYADPDAQAAQAQQLADRLSLRVHAEGELDGTLYGHVLRVGELVAVDGSGDTFDGRWYVDTVTHRFDGEGYRQRFELLRNGVGNDLG